MFLETAACGCARGKAKLFAKIIEVGFDRCVIVCANDSDGAVPARRREMIDLFDFRGRYSSWCITQTPIDMNGWFTAEVLEMVSGQGGVGKSCDKQYRAKD